MGKGGGLAGPRVMPELTEITDQTFNAEVVDSSLPVLIDFWAEWCHPCHIIEPHLKALAEQLSDKLKVVKLDIDENPDIARQYAVWSIPTLLLFIDGVEKARIVGAQPKDRILAQIESYL
jgi:thioredoxin 1